MDKLKSIYASAYSSTITIIIVVGLTIGAELAPVFKSWLANLTGHHWVSKSWISIIAFILFFVLFKFLKKTVNESQTRKALAVLQVFVVLGFIAILGFYLWFSHS